MDLISAFVGALIAVLATFLLRTVCILFFVEIGLTKVRRLHGPLAVSAYSDQ